MNQVIPLMSTPNQTLSCKVRIDDGTQINLKFFLNFNEIARYWTMDVTNADINARYLTGIPLVPGDYPAGNILAQYSYLKIGSAYMVKLSDLIDPLPQPNNLGTEWFLVWGDNV